MTIGQSKRKSLRIFALTMVGVLLGATGFAIPMVGGGIGLAVMLLSLMIGFAFAAQLRCSHCGFVLSRKFPVGALIVLWLAKNKCPNCNEEL
jgi:hypothetical protein